MSKVKYRYNTKSLTYEKVEISWQRKLLTVMSFLLTGAVFGSIFFFLAYTYMDSPKEKELKRENKQLQLRYEFLNKKLDEVFAVLNDVEDRDDNIYRVIFEAEPIPKNIRNAGFGGVNRYKELEGYRSSELMKESSKTMDKILKKLYIQSKSYDEVMEMAMKKKELLAAIPAIQPVSNKDLKRMASGYGYRIDPHYKTRALHTGMDFTAPTGTPIYATGNGTIKRADNSAKGYGNHVRIDHGYGYVTLYAHMSKILVRPGQKVKRGDIIGLVGNTGKSVGPHCHYEVRKNGTPLNPVNFYFNDLSPVQYEIMVKMANASNQSLD
ncbi:MAG: peptidoglycan DD-metalloendopeptidase family protein [Vicingaceae bacterium]